MRRHLSLVSILLSFAIVVAGQQPPPAAQPPQQPAPQSPEKAAPPAPKDEDAGGDGQESQVTARRSIAQDDDGDERRDDVVRITTNLVQIDVTVTDGDGRQVTDLKPEDFEILEEGRPQKITNFSYVVPSAAQKVVAPTTAAIALPGVVSKKGKAVAVTPPVPPVRLRPEQVRRTVALVVDDLGLSHGSASRTRDALRKFVDEQMQPGDLVAVIRTGAGMGALQQFTADKQMLRAAIERVRYNLGSRSSVNSFAVVDTGEILTKRVKIPGALPELPDPVRGPFTQDISQPGREIDEFREELFSVGTLGALNFVVRGLKDLPGRKSVILFSDGFKMYTQDAGNDRVRENLRRLTDLANRASVVFYTIDPRGLETLTFTAADNLSGPLAANGEISNGGAGGDANSSQWMADLDQRLTDRRQEFFETQAGLSFLAAQTGGFLVKNNNDIGGAVRRVMNDQSGFYLLGYRPDDEAFKDGRRGFRSLTVKLKRPGMRVRTRSGFYNFTDEEVRRVRRTQSEQLFAALSSPFGAGDVRVRMTSSFGYDMERKTHLTKSLLHIDARDLSFKKESDNTRKAVIEVMAVTFGDNGQVVDKDDRLYTVRVPEQDFQRTQTAGFVYTVALPIKKPGAYQLRIAVMDTANGRVGSANRFINVPDLRKGGLTLSGMTLRGTRAGVAVRASAGGPGDAPQAAPLAGGATADEVELHAGPAARKMRRGMLLEYGYFIYNAQLDKGTARPQLVTQPRLLRDGQIVYEGKVWEYDAPGQTDMRQIFAGGEIRLGTNLPPGEYVLQVVVYDRLAKEERALATQWIDFDIVE